MIRICKICGKEFETGGTPAKCCSKKCMVENNRRIAEERRKLKKEGKPVQPKRKKKAVNNEITRLAIEARKHGMSYGQYVAQMQFQKVGGSSV